MKTKRLIEMLQAVDPSGELEVVSGNHDIYFATRAPGYYDGCAQILIRDESRKDYNITGVRIQSKADKIQLRSMGVKDVLYDDPEAPVEYDEYSRKNWFDRVEAIRAEVRELDSEIKKELKEKA